MHHPFRRTPAVVLVMGLLALGSGAGAAPVGPASVFPGTVWARASAAEAGFDAKGLAQLAADAKAAGSSCISVTRNGKLVEDRNWGLAADAPREAFSVTKSVTSTLLGIARGDGALRFADPASTYLPQWRRTPSASVKVLDLLSNDSGRQWSLGIDYGQLIRSPDKTAFALGLGQERPPGQAWAYNNSAIQTLSAVMKAAVPTPLTAYAKAKLFTPIGMARSALSPDAHGNTLTFMGLKTTCQDLARFGYLMLNQGSWKGRQVVSAGYVKQATGRPSTKLNAAYGLLWWLNRKGPIGSVRLATTGVADAPIKDGQLDEAAPADVFWALGFNDQIVAVIPSEGIVAVRMGAAPPADAPFTMKEFTDGVLAALVPE